MKTQALTFKSLRELSNERALLYLHENGLFPFRGCGATLVQCPLSHASLRMSGFGTRHFLRLPDDYI